MNVLIDFNTTCNYPIRHRILKKLFCKNVSN